MVAPPLLQRGDILIFLKWETTRGLPLPPPSKIYRRQLCQGFFSFCNGIFNMSLAGMMTMPKRNFMFFCSWEANFAEVVCTLSPKSHESKLEKKTMSAEHTTVFSFLLAIRRIFLRWQLSSPRNARQKKGRVEESGFSFFSPFFWENTAMRLFYFSLIPRFLSHSKKPQEEAKQRPILSSLLVWRAVTGRRN